MKTIPLTKAIPITIIGALLAGGALLIRARRGRAQTSQQPSAIVQQGEPGSLQRQIYDARAAGSHEVQLSLLNCGWDIGSLRQALARDTVVLAEVTGKETFADKYDLRTWYRFKIIDTLAEKPMPKYAIYSSLPDPPEDMQPVKADEFVALEANGQLEIDGVKVTQRSNGVEYAVGRTYLIFLHIDPFKRVAVRSGTDPLGVFLVSKDGTFKPYVDVQYPLRDQLAKRFGNSIAKLRDGLKK